MKIKAQCLKEKLFIKKPLKTPACPHLGNTNIFSKIYMYILATIYKLFIYKYSHC